MDNVDYSSARRYLTSGPLILDGIRSFALIDGEKLALNEMQVDALYLLMQREGAFLTFEQLHHTLWESIEGIECRDTARAELDHLAETVNAAGMGAVCVEYIPEKGYRFLTLQA